MTLQLIKSDNLPNPQGKQKVVWRPDPKRWDVDDQYRRQVTEFVEQHFPGRSITDPEVRQDEAGTAVLRITSFLDQEGELNRDAAGRVVSRAYFSHIPPGTVLP